jgi:shikimate dehydrogenase
MRTYGLIGYPLKHSFSPEFFTRKFKRENIQAEYKLFPTKDISQLPWLVELNPSLEGLNVTIPYKEKVIDFLDDIRGDAKMINAVNTIVIKRQKDSRSLIGYNTDTLGFQKSLKKHISGNIKSALILGSGGTSKTVAWVLQKLNISYTFITRHCSNNENYISYDDLSHEVVYQNKLIINTTPLGMYPDIHNYPPIYYDAITTDHIVFDVIYNPPLTKFLEFSSEQGAEIVNGQEMLEYQAEESWRLWNADK